MLGLPQVGIDEQHPALIRMTERERQVGRGQGLPFGRHRTGHHQRSRAGLQLVMMQRRSEPAILLDQRRVGGGTDDDLAEALLRRTGMCARTLLAVGAGR